MAKSTLGGQLANLVLVCLVLVSIGSAQAPGAPSNLKATTATKSQVVLTWTAGTGATSYSVERRVLGGVFAALTPAPTGTTFTDSNFDQFQIYSYRVISVNTTGVSVPSNEIQTGPPPVGFNLASKPPTTVKSTDQWGPQLAMALDTNGDPVFAFVHVDPNNDENQADNILYFLGWDRAGYKWRDPIKVDVIASVISGQNGGLVTSIAVDVSTGRMGIAFARGGSQLAVAFSTDVGATWTLQNITTSTQGVLYPQLALVGGTVHLAANVSNALSSYWTGAATSAASAWTKTDIPVPAGNSGFDAPLSLAVDSAGKPGLVFWAANGPTGPSLSFWRPGNATSTRIFSSQADRGNFDQKLVFAGLQPRLVFVADENQIWFTQSNDAGTTWSTRVAIPRDGGVVWGAPVTLGVTSTGFATMSAVASGGTGGDKCRYPKWATSSNLTTWTTCSPQGNGSPEFGFSLYPSIIYGTNDKLYLGFVQTDATVAEIPAGIIVYREPLVAGLTPPQLSTGGVVNGASFAAGAAIAPGSITSIFGTNLATSAGGSTSVPLATTLLSTSVSIAGKSAPLYYVSPTQLNVQVPVDAPTGSQAVRVTVNGLQSNAINVNIANAAPGIFLYDGGKAVAQDGGFIIIGPSNPAKSGNQILIYATGQGPTNPVVPSGTAAPTTQPLALTSLTVTATINGVNAPVAFSGLTPGLVGLWQINVVVPVVPAAGDYPVIVTIGGVASNTAMMSVRP